MPPTPSRLHHTLTFLSTTTGLLAIGGGIYSLIDPLAFSATLGIPATAPVVGARNLSSGLSVLTLLWMGRREAAGTLLMVGGVGPGWVDAWIRYGYDGWEGKAVGHAGMAAAVGLVGAGLVWG